MPASSTRLKITEIFYSLQGEALTVGLPTIFIRLTGCPLRCHYCDTAYAFSGGEWQTIAQVLDTVATFNTPHVTVTGGEPLAQKACLELLTALADREYRVSLETSGALPLQAVDSRVVVVMDIKTPSSGEAARNLPANIDWLRPQDQIKFVIGDESDYEWSKSRLQTERLNRRCEVLFSPVQDNLPATTLADWILRDQLPVRFQIQLHKLLWGDRPGV